MKQALTSKQIQAVELLATGLQQREVAALIGVHETTICRWKKDANFCIAVEKKSADWFKENTPIAQATALQIMLDDSQKAADRIKVAFNIMDRAGHVPTQKQEVSIEPVHITIDYGDDA